MYFIVGYFIRLVQNQISFTFCCQRNNKCRREKKNNNNVEQFVQKCKNSMFVIFSLLVKILNLFNLLLSTRKSVAEKKRHLSFKIICKI